MTELAVRSCLDFDILNNVIPIENPKKRLLKMRSISNAFEAIN